MSSQSRLVFEEENLRIPGVHSLGQYHYTSAEPGLPPHQHKGCVEISLLVRGYQAYQVGGQVYHVKGGEQYISLPDEIHDTASEPEEKGILYWLILDVTQAPDKFLFLGPPMAEKLIGELVGFTSRHFAGDFDSRATLDKAFRALEPIRIPDEGTGIFRSQGHPTPSTSRRTKIDSAGFAGSSRELEVASHLVHYILQTLRASRANIHHISPVIQASLDFIARNEDEWLKVVRVAEQVQLSESNFKLRFREEVGLPPAEYMLHRKIIAAKARLNKPGANITDVAYSLGFSSSQYFATVFKRYQLISPSQYRNRTQPSRAR